MSPPDAREVAGGLVCAPYVVGNLKENFKSDTPNEYVAAGIHECTHLCVYIPQSVNIEYTCSRLLQPYRAGRG